MCKGEEPGVQKSEESSDSRVIERTAEYEVVKSGDYTFKFLNQKPEGGEIMAQNTEGENIDNDDIDILSLNLDEKEHKKEEKDNDDFADAGNENMSLLPALSGDALIVNLARIHTHEFPFLRAMLENGPELIPDGKCTPGIIERLIYEYMLKMIEGSAAPHRAIAVQIIRKMWINANPK